MERLRFSVKRVEEEPNGELDACKLLGSPVMPEGFFDAAKLDDYDYFVAQIRCDALPSRAPFPTKGYLYVFLNADTLKPKVLYTEKEPAEVIGDVNASFDPSLGDATCLQMVFDGKGGCSLFSEIDPDIGLEGYTDTDGKLTLLQLDGLTLPPDEEKPFRFGNFGLGDGHWVFLIKEEDLIKKNFKHVEFYELED